VHRAGLYLARTVGPALTKVLAEVVLQRPAEPLDFIAEWLLKYQKQMKQMTNASDGRK
jgi:hypothetical protein